MAKRKRSSTSKTPKTAGRIRGKGAKRRGRGRGKKDEVSSNEAMVEDKVVDKNGVDMLVDSHNAPGDGLCSPSPNAEAVLPGSSKKAYEPQSWTSNLAPASNADRQPEPDSEDMDDFDELDTLTPRLCRISSRITVPGPSSTAATAPTSAEQVSHHNSTLPNDRRIPNPSTSSASVTAPVSREPSQECTLAPSDEHRTPIAPAPSSASIAAPTSREPSLEYVTPAPSDEHTAPMAPGLASMSVAAQTSREQSRPPSLSPTPPNGDTNLTPSSPVATCEMLASRVEDPHDLTLTSGDAVEASTSSSSVYIEQFVTDNGASASTSSIDIENTDIVSDAISITSEDPPVDPNEIIIDSIDSTPASTLPEVAGPSSPPKPKPRAPTPPEEPALLCTYSCPICFCPPTNATLVPCGHICCGECLFVAVKTGLKRGIDGIARCPVCRTTIAGWDGVGGGVIGLKARTALSLC